MKQIIILLIVSAVLSSCGANNADKQQMVKDTVKATDAIHTAKANSGLPFVGKRSFETRPAASGTGTPSRYIEILADSDVFFSFVQENQGDGTETKERYYAGKFTPYLKCVFKKWDNETTYYELVGNKIYEVDKNHKRISSDECCSNEQYNPGVVCACESELWKE